MKVLAIDYGKRHIGLALGDTNLKVAIPINSIRNSGEGAIREILKKVKEYNISLILLGLPLTPSGKEGERAMEVRSFFESLKAQLPEDVEISLWDERYTTKEAYNLMKDLNWRKKKRFKDSLSAYVILLEYMESL